MDANTSGEELLAKARKPYTITKQRERWTDDEHDRFLEALRLYGRAWQRIEEHIGTKTAVQIRSHAQKFFTKLEKEAQAKGLPVCQAMDIEIPPPRPKRKPTTPYPRKPGNGASSSHLSSAKDTKLVSSASSSRCTQTLLDLEKPPFTEPTGVQKTSTGKENQDDNCSGITTRPHEAHCSSISSVNKYPLPKKVNPGNPTTFMESEQSLRKQASPDNGTNKASNLDNSCSSKDNAVQDIPKTNKDRDGDVDNGPPHSMQNLMFTCSQNPPGMISQDLMFHPMGEVNGHSGSFTNPATSSATQHQDNVFRSFHQAPPAFHPAAFNPACHTQDDYRSFLQMSTTFSNLIISSLLQNPAAHAAATFAASFWPYANVGSSGDSSTSTNQTDGTFPPRQMTSPPSVAAIASATVAAATAWWAAHGLLPVCAPLACHPIPTATVPPPGSGETTMTESGKNETTTTIENAEELVRKQSKAQEDQNLASKSPASSSDDSDETGITKVNTDSKTEKEEVVAVHDSNTTQKKRPVDRSSCGSNTPSGSDAETDALEKVEKDKEDVMEMDTTNQPALELSNRRTKIRDNTNPTTDSWKEVSQGGRLAFQALFARERLPQSFSPPQNAADKEKQNQNNMSMPLVSNNNNQDSADQERLVMIGNVPGKSLKSRQTGFKPYKRCSMEVKESQVGNTNNQSDEKVCKRIRLEGEAST